MIAAQMARIGLEAGGDSGYFQRVPGVAAANGRISTVASMAIRDTFPVGQRRLTVNVIGILRGVDPQARDSVVVIGGHYDHLGTGAAQNGDSIYNGADDDASGVVAALEIARVMAGSPRPRRTVVFVAFTGEERGFVGTNWYIQHPVVPLDRMVANMQIEMIGRPDSLAGGPGRAWLTGYELSTMGDMLSAAGVPIVPDKRPSQNFFSRSDNYAFALAGIPAHTLSSFNLHQDYHRVTDDVSRVDFDHMAAVISAAIRAARILADGPAPVWHPGKRPCPRNNPTCGG
jgi:Zn-dependent M28 family amino/carboxypeptidase